MNQTTALALLKSGRNVFLTGSAGTGKTYVLNQFIQHLKDAKVEVAVTASTGIAATHVKGHTIHSWSGIGVKQELSGSDLKAMARRKSFRDQLNKTKVLVIDEISMLHKQQLNAINQVLCYIRDNDEPFGGLQLVLCGDFFQLPPIGERHELSRDKFAFMSEAWVSASFAICYLDKQYRQDDNHLHEILNEIRSGSVTESTLIRLRMARETEFESGIEPTMLYTHNADVGRINNEHLADLPSKSRFFKAQTRGEKALVDTLRKSVLTDDDMPLRIGAKVMFVKNNPDRGFINGTLGEIVDWSDIGHPVVKTIDGDRITASQEEWSIDDENGRSLASYIQVPLRLAWAITVHKSQGMTLDAAELDLSKTFERGQGYVALSRLRSIEKLRLLGFNQRALEVDPLAMKADRRFQELSTEIEADIDLLALDEERKAFVKKSGGRNLKKV